MRKTKGVDVTRKAVEKGVSRRLFLALVGGAAALSACGF